MYRRMSSINRVYSYGLLVLFLFADLSATLFFPNLISYHTFTSRSNCRFSFVISLGENGILSGGNNNYSEYIVKTDNLGRTLWDYSPGASSYPSFLSTALVTRDGKTLLAGTAKISLDTASMTWFEVVRLTALNVAGEPEWERVYHDTTYNMPATMAETDDGGILIAGNIGWKMGATPFKGFFIKTDGAGNELSRKFCTFGTQPILIIAMEKATGGTFLVLGHKEIENAACLLKVNSTGDTMWSRTFYYKAGNRLSSICQTDDGNYLAAGASVNLDGNSDFFVLKLDGNGNTLWYKNYDLGRSEGATAVDTVSGGGYCLAGLSDSRCVLLRIAANGDSLRTVDYGSTGQHSPAAIASCSGGRIAVVGTNGRDHSTNAGFLMVFESEAQSSHYPEFANWEVLNKGTSGIYSNQIQMMAVDSANRLWVVVKDDMTGYPRIMYRDKTAWPLFNGIPEQNLTDLSIGSTGTAWFVGSKSIYGYDGNKLTQISLPQSGYSFNIAPLDDSTVYVAGGGGLYLAAKGKTAQQFPEANDFLASKAIDDVAIDRAKSVWYVPFFGIAVKNGSGITHYTAKNTTIPEFQASRISVDASGAVWASTSTGLVRYVNSTWSKFDSINSPLPTNMITAYVIDSAGVPYAACSRGFANLSRKTNTLYSYSNSPLPSNAIQCLEIDKRGNIWIGTDQGLVCIHSEPFTSAIPSHPRAIVSPRSARRRVSLSQSTVACRPAEVKTDQYFDLRGRSLGNGSKSPGAGGRASNLLLGIQIK